MTVETLYDDHMVSDPYVGGSYSVMYFEAGDGNLKAGLLATGDPTDGNEVIINPTTGVAFGMVGKLPDIDIETAQTVEFPVKLYILGSGPIVWLAHDANSETIVLGGRIQSSQSVAGKTRNAPAYVVKEASYVAGNFSERGDTSNFHVGRAAQRVVTGGNEVWYQAILGL